MQEILVLSEPVCFFELEVRARDQLVLRQRFQRQFPESLGRDLQSTVPVPCVCIFLPVFPLVLRRQSQVHAVLLGLDDADILPIGAAEQVPVHHDAVQSVLEIVEDRLGSSGDILRENTESLL